MAESQESPIEQPLKTSLFTSLKNSQEQQEQQPGSEGEISRQMLSSSLKDIRNYMKIDDRQKGSETPIFSANMSLKPINREKAVTKFGSAQHVQHAKHGQNNQQQLPQRGSNKKRRNKRIATPKRINTPFTTFSPKLNNDNSLDNKRRRSEGDEQPSKLTPTKRNKNNEVQNNRADSECTPIRASLQHLSEDEDAIANTYMQTDSREDSPDDSQTQESENSDTDEGQINDAMESPKSVSLEMVYSMFKKIQGDINTIKKDRLGSRVTVLEKDAKKQDEMMNNFQFVQLQQGEKIKTMERELDLFKTRTEILTKMFLKMELVVGEHGHKLEQLDLQKAKCSILVKNFYTGTSLAEAKYLIYELFITNLKIDVVIDEMYFQAEYQPRPIVLVMQNLDDKKTVMRSVSQATNLMNSDGRKYIFLDFYTPQTKETRNRNQHIFDLYANNPAQQEHIVLTKKGVKVGAELYRKKVVAPSMNDIMSLNEDEFRRILSIPVTTGKPVNEDGSCFTGYTVCAQSHKEIRDVYMKLKLANAEARHIVCAYNLPGLDLHHCKDYWDDEEHGAGKFLLRLLIDHKITSRAIFVVRHVQGKKIGSIRHKCFMDAAINAINVNPYNKFAKCNQSITSQNRPTEVAVWKQGKSKIKFVKEEKPKTNTTHPKQAVRKPPPHQQQSPPPPPQFTPNAWSKPPPPTPFLTQLQQLQKSWGKSAKSTS